MEYKESFRHTACDLTRGIWLAVHGVVGDYSWEAGLTGATSEWPTNRELGDFALYCGVTRG
jgi:hypothetical protein